MTKIERCACPLEGSPFAARLVLLAAALLLAASFAGCAVTRPHRSEKELDLAHQRIVEEIIRDRVEMSHTVVNRMLMEMEESSSDNETYDVLILSGGGDYGAFGAGFLKGWGTVDDPQMTRPVFDAVTGVSTGALIAPLAFVGTEDAYDQAFTVYRNPGEDWFALRLFSFLFKRHSLLDNSGLAEQVKESIDEGIIRAIAEGAGESRYLAIGTTNMDQGMVKMWDLGKEARRIVQERKPPERFYDIILASTAIPGAFPPVEIDGDLYVDGGVTRNIAYTTDQDYSQSAFNIWNREQSEKAWPKMRFWIVINNQLGTYQRTVQPAWPKLMTRSLEMAIRASTLASLKSIELAARLMNLQGRVKVEFRFIAIPDDWRPPVEGSFQKETMESLAELGFELGSDPSTWRTKVPNPESPTPGNGR